MEKVKRLIQAISELNLTPQEAIEMLSAEIAKATEVKKTSETTSTDLRHEIFEHVVTWLKKEKILFPEDDVSLASKMKNDLGMDSFEIMELEIYLEQKYSISSSDYLNIEEWKTLGDVVDTFYLCISCQQNANQ